MPTILELNLDNLLHEIAHEQAAIGIMTVRRAEDWTLDEFEQSLYDVMVKHFVEFCGRNQTGKSKLKN